MSDKDFVKKYLKDFSSLITPTDEKSFKYFFTKSLSDIKIYIN